MEHTADVGKHPDLTPLCDTPVLFFQKYASLFRETNFCNDAEDVERDLRGETDPERVVAILRRNIHRLVVEGIRKAAEELDFHGC